jgi:hypothetical protein
VAEFRKRASLDLAYALAGDAKLATHLLQRECMAVAQAEAKLKH